VLWLRRRERREGEKKKVFSFLFAERDRDKAIVTFAFQSCFANAPLHTRDELELIKNERFFTDKGCAMCVSVFVSLPNEARAIVTQRRLVKVLLGHAMLSTHFFLNTQTSIE
jgi:hypothetical protein